MTPTTNSRGRAVARGARLALALCAAGLLACSDKKGNDPAEPRTYAFSLVTPRTDDGAVAVTLAGAPMTDVVVSGSTARVFTRQVSPSELRVLVVGNVTAGQLFTARSTTGKRPTATVTEVADRSDALRASVTGYSITAQ